MASLEPTLALVICTGVGALLTADVVEEVGELEVLLLSDEDVAEVDGLLPGVLEQPTINALAIAPVKTIHAGRRIGKTVLLRSVPANAVPAAA